ncbi:MAG: hypothetical protein QG583_63 [Patescibacteria group bacterium]|nr:hypothetical protein [Patescibacteria group bacterium]
MKKIYIKNILPSKKFAIIMSLVTGVLLIIFLIFFFFSGKENFISKKEKARIENSTVVELIQNDTDGDTIPDWEEALWGTDKNNKNTFEISDVAYIDNKKKELNLDQEINLNENNLTETDKFAQEFFTAYTALKASGGADQNTINSFSSALGQKIVNPALTDVYKEGDANVEITDTKTSREKYYATLQNLYTQYQDSGIGDELDIVSSGLISYDGEGKESTYDELLLISEAYQGFAKKVMETPVPKSLLTHHLRIANGAHNTGVSVLSMTKIITDPVVGLSGLSQYQTYSDDLINAVTDLEETL